MLQKSGDKKIINKEKDKTEKYQNFKYQDRKKIDVISVVL